MFEESLNIEKMNDIQKKAYKSWKDQGQRCQNKNNPRFYCYGAKGIKRVYSSREFISWYEAQHALLGPFKKPNVDRINSDGNYCFENIRLIECSDNVKLRNEEHGNPEDSKMVIATNLITGEKTEFASIREASRSIGITRKSIQNQIRGLTSGRKPSSGFFFSYS